MPKQKKVTDKGFSLRFEEFLTKSNLNTNSLAVELNDSNPVKFRRWIAGEVAPNYSELHIIAAHYNLSLDWLAFGEGSMKRGDSLPKPPNSGELKQAGLAADQLDWKSRFETLEKKYDDLFKEYRDFVQSVTQKMKMSFNPAGSQTTAEAFGFAFQVVGLTGDVYSGLDIEDSVPVIPLNSLDNVRSMYAKLTA